MTTTPTGYGPEDATLLGKLITRLNPAWDEMGVWAALRRHAQDRIPFAHTAVAAIQAAANPANHERGQGNTPERIWFAGHHWPNETRATLPTGPACDAHPTFPANGCPCCAGDVLVGDRTRDQIGKDINPTDFRAAVACQDHPESPAGTCRTCWDEVQTGTRRRARVGQTNTQATNQA